MGCAVRVRVAVRVWVSVAAILVSGLSPTIAQDSTETAASARLIGLPSDVVVRHEHIAIIKAALNLRPAQEQYWLPVEAALADMARWQANAEAASAEGVRPHDAVMSRLKRIAHIAAPLIKVLDDEQRQSMQMLARSAGLEVLLVSK